MILNGKVINPGEFRTQITLEERAEATSSGGYKSPTWSPLKTVWSRWKNAHGAESFQAALEGVSAPATVLIRYIDGLDETCAVLKGANRYEIISIDNIEERSEYIELKVRRMKGG